MFTGLIDAIGTIEMLRPSQKGVVLKIRCHYDRYELGESIAVDGTCLTVTEFLNAASTDGYFFAEASAETLKLTTLGQKKVGSEVHLERALQVGARIGGHLVSGHVDGTGKLASRTPLGDAVKCVFSVPPRLRPFLAAKGSITINGVSLTVNGVQDDGFDVVLVPFTRSETRFDALAVGASVNLEVDVLAKYVASLLGKPGVDGKAPSDTKATHGLDLDTLKRNGFA